MAKMMIFREEKYNFFSFSSKKSTHNWMGDEGIAFDRRRLYGMIISGLGRMLSPNMLCKMLENQTI